jgi:hypothetical protein
MGDDGAEISWLGGTHRDDGGRLYDLRPACVVVSKVMSGKWESKMGPAGQSERDISCELSLALALKSASI